MASKELKIIYEEFTSASQMSERDQMLVAAALDAQKGSYSPYSQFQVGAVLLLADGTVVKGANQENAAYPSGLCAERTAMFAASANYPDVPMVALAIAGSDHGVLCNSPATPCGACRQVMAQYQRKYQRKIEVILVGKKKIMKFEKVEDILPFVFSSLD